MIKLLLFFNDRIFTFNVKIKKCTIWHLFSLELIQKTFQLFPHFTYFFCCLSFITMILGLTYLVFLMLVDGLGTKINGDGIAYYNNLINAFLDKSMKFLYLTSFYLQHVTYLETLLL